MDVPDDGHRELKRPRRSTRLSAEAAKAQRAVEAAARAAERARAAALRTAKSDAKRLRRRGTKLSFEANGAVVCETASFPAGLARFEVEVSLREVHDQIKREARSRMRWAGGGDESDQRWRAFGLPTGARDFLKGIRMHAVESKDVEAEMAASWASCVDLPEFDPETVAPVIRKAEGALRQTLGPLVALQPNVHAGTAFLPAHLDWPLHDGFGEVIVTVPVRQRHTATVVLVDRQDREFYFDLAPSQAYVLAGDARNLFLHGLFAFEDPFRESLNLRFGIHDRDEARRLVYAPWGAEDYLILA